MFKLLAVVVILINCAYSQQIIGTPCTLQSSKSPGVCKSLTECKEIRDEVVFSQKLPQTCGFEDTRAIVCCPKIHQPGYISKQKCREYSSYIQEENECGHRIVKRIVGGELAGRKEFPHMAAIGVKSDSGNIQWTCGGSLISEQYIITAAQCSFNRDFGEPTTVVLGVTNLNDSSHRQEIKIAERLVHPEYRAYSHYDDIALFKLEKSAKMNSYVRPACLYTNSQFTITTAVATGWGYTDAFGKESADLRKVTLEIVDHDFCNRSYPYTRKLKNGIVDDLQICTGRGTDEKDTCSGDGGGPLQTSHTGDDVTCMHDIIGLTSFGKIPCNGGPSVSTRVSHYIKWIEDIVWPQNIS